MGEQKAAAYWAEKIKLEKKKAAVAKATRVTDPRQVWLLDCCAPEYRRLIPTDTAFHPGRTARMALQLWPSPLHSPLAKHPHIMPLSTPGVAAQLQRCPSLSLNLREFSTHSPKKK